MSIVKAPCQNCPDRLPGCHDKCEKYKEFCKENERLKAVMKKNGMKYWKSLTLNRPKRVRKFNGIRKN